jgi:hypothetical protein
MTGARKPSSSKAPPSGRGSNGGAGDSFPQALAALLRSRRIRVPAGLADAPRQAYASQPASYVGELARLGDDELKRYAQKIAGYARRQAERARADWESSPLIAELRRRGLKEPPCPVRVVGASVSLTKPLREWSDAEILRAADEWSRMGQP